MVSEVGRLLHMVLGWYIAVPIEHVMFFSAKMALLGACFSAGKIYVYVRDGRTLTLVPPVIARYTLCDCVVCQHFTAAAAVDDDVV